MASLSARLSSSAAASWFLGCLLRAVQGADATLAGVLDGMEGKLTNARWASIGKCPADIALRDINDLLERGVLRRLEGGGRSTGYALCGWKGKE